MTTTEQANGPHRRFLHPNPGETLRAVAARAIGSANGAISDEAFDEVLSWNIHLSNDLFSALGPKEVALLPSEIIYIEPPLAISK